jgi:hypothetical protein
MNPCLTPSRTTVHDQPGLAAHFRRRLRPSQAVNPSAAAVIALARPGTISRSTESDN